MGELISTNTRLDSDRSVGADGQPSNCNVLAWRELETLTTAFRPCYKIRQVAIGRVATKTSRLPPGGPGVFRTSNPTLARLLRTSPLTQ